MKRLALRHVVMVAVVCLAAPVVLAQSDRVSLRMAPRPDQTVRMNMTQEMDFEMSLDGAAPPGLTGPMKMLVRTTMTVTQRIGPRRSDGTTEAELTFDQVQTEMSMNGQPMPGAGANNPFVGKPVVMTYGSNGEVVAAKGFPAAGLPDDVFQQFMGSVWGSMPATALAVGETATAPLDITLPLPIPVTAPMKMTGQTKVKLVSIDQDAQGRSARFEASMDGTMVADMASPDGKGRMTFNFTMGGDGFTVMDLDKGVMRSNQSTSTFTGKVGVPAGAAPAAMPSMNIRGVIKVTTTSN